LTLVGGVTVSDALAGPPMRIEEMNVVAHKIPQNARLMLEFTGNCMARLPQSLSGKIQIERDGKPVSGSWQKETHVGLAPDRLVRFSFSGAGMTPGTYKVVFLDRTLPGSSRSGLVVTVTDEIDRTPPRFRGLTGASCTISRGEAGYREGCGEAEDGVGFEAAGPPRDAYRAFTVFAARKRGEPYQRGQHWETRWLPNPGGIPWLTTGEWIVTLRGVDLAGNIGGRICEMPMTIPFDCNKFPAQRRAGAPKKHPLAELGTAGNIGTAHKETRGPVKAVCARPGKKPGTVVSAIDGVVLEAPEESEDQ
jgi:hypothetical protein